MKEFLKKKLPRILGHKVYSATTKVYRRILKPKIVLENWTHWLNESRVDATLKQMIASCESHQNEFTISHYWKYLNNKNIAQLTENGFENFKQTVALNYFTWVTEAANPHIEFLKNNLSADIVAAAAQKSQSSIKYPLLTQDQSRCYYFLTLLLWEFAKKYVAKDILEQLKEPLAGNPPIVNVDGKSVSQDLLNSAIEYSSLKDALDGFKGISTILEIGAGYGRTAYVFLSLNPAIKYTIVDVPPALYISQRYLTSVFPGKRIFPFQDFSDFSQIADDFFKADIRFLLPHQLKKIPKNSVDLFLAIDCLHEMLPRQINFYFNEVDRLAKNFYFKCWKKTTVPFDNVTLEEKGYPVKKFWKKVFWRDCKIQANYFEAHFILDKN